MNVPDFIQEPIGEISPGLDGNPTVYFHTAWQYWFDQLINELQINLGPEGFVVPSLSSDPNSVFPPTTGGQIGIVENGALTGTLIYDTFTNQLKLKKPTGFVVVV
jgi:hypothetical protein